MIRSRRFGPVGVVAFVAVCGLSLLPSRSAAQAGLNLTGASNCTAADFDATLQFVNGPGDYFAIVVNKRNISGHPCIFDGPMYGPSFVPDRLAGGKPFALCYDCENRLRNGQQPMVPPLTVKPNQVAQQTFRWRTIPSSEAVSCLQPDWMSGPVLLVARSLLKRICSDIEVSRFSLATSSASAAEEDQQVNGGQAPGLKLTSDKNNYYAREGFSVHVSLAPEVTARTTARTEENCPTLYLRQRSPDGETRIDEVQPLAFKGCGRPVLGHQVGDWQSGFELDSGANSKWEGFGVHILQVSQLAGSLDDEEIRFVSSNILRIQLADAAVITRKWGTRVKGITADITLDKETFRVGEDIALHLAIADFNADGQIYSWDPVWDPCVVVGIEVQDAEGHPVPADDRFPNWSICTGHGFGPRPFPKGKVVPLERTLGSEGWLPNHPGTYKVVITWAPCVGSNKSTSKAGASAKSKPYAVARAMATIHVIGSDISSK